MYPAKPAGKNTNPVLIANMRGVYEELKPQVAQAQTGNGKTNAAAANTFAIRPVDRL